MVCGAAVVGRWRGQELGEAALGQIFNGQPKGEAIPECAQVVTLRQFVRCAEKRDERHPDALAAVIELRSFMIVSSVLRTAELALKGSSAKHTSASGNMPVVTRR